MHNPTIGYEIFTASFCDSNGDGTGDLQGIISKLGYLKELGVDCIWLTPIHPSPTYHKYDILDYYAIDPSFGTLDDLKELLEHAHQSGIQVLLDLVINHTSDQHPWFQEALKNPESEYHDFYIWMHPEEIEARGIAFREGTHDTDQTEPWHTAPGHEQKYYGAFWKGMPDLNFRSERLKEEIRKIIHYWLVEIGVDGFRMDAARHIFPHWEKEKNPEFWKEFKGWVEETGKPCFTIGEVWATTDETAPYLAGLNSIFNFDLYFLLQQIFKEESDPGLVKALTDIYQQYSDYSDSFTDTIILSNHDQDRITTSTDNYRKKNKLAASILLTLPGLPFLYYGEEIGMLGRKPDPFIREPFLWSDDPHDPAITRVVDACYSTPDTVRPLNKQQESEDSVFHHYKKMIALRRSEPSLASSQNYNLQSVETQDPQLLIYIRPHSERSVIVLHNLSGTDKQLPEIPRVSEILFCNTLYQASLLQELTLSPYSSIVALIENPE